MAYFNELPNILYPSLLSSNNRIEDKIEVKNIFKRSKLRTDVDQVITAFNYYYIPEGDRPDIVAENVYNDSELDWVVLTSNNITNIRDQWPLSHNDLHTFMLEKYGSEQNILGVHHYETKKIVDEYNRVVMPAGLEVDMNFSFEYLSYSKQIVKIISSRVVAMITNYDYERRLNDEKRRIKILKPEFLPVFLTDHQNIMRYSESSDFISDKLKNTYNPRISGV
tara:strand:+ start:373 stop:1041 length:669 start_codon:yes stop_codon:yes gene_type:complete